MNNKWLALIFVCLALMVGAGAWLFFQTTGKTAYDGNLDVASNVSQENRRDSNVLIVGLDPNYPPMEFLDAESRFAGFDIDLMKIAFQKMGRQYEIKAIKWDEKTDLLNNKTIDLIWSGLNITDERRGLYELSKSYFKGTQVIAVPSHSNITHKSQLAGKQVGIQKGTFIMPMLEEFNKKNPTGRIASIIEYNDSATAMTKMLEDQIDAVISDGLNVLYYAANSEGRFRVLPELFLETDGTGVAARKGDRQLITEINQTLDEMRRDGSYQKVYKKWFGE